MMRRATAVSIAFLLLAAALCARGTAADDQESVESGRESLSHRSSYPWYDSQHDSVRRIELSPQEKDDSDDLRSSNWEAKPDSERKQLAEPALLGRVAQFFFWALLAGVLAGVVALLVWAFFRRESRQTGADAVTSQVSREVDRLDELPFAVKRPQSDLLGEARRHYEAGNFAEAIVYLFSYELVELDKHQVIRLTKGKTNRQYLGEARRRPTVLPLLEDTMIAFEDVFFGKHGLNRERFETCWTRIADFQRNLQGGAA